MEELQAVSLFLLLGALSAVLNVKNLQAQENVEASVAPAASSSQKELLKNGDSDQMSGSLHEGVSQETQEELRIAAKATLGVESNAYVWGTREHEATSTASAEATLGLDLYTLSGRLAAARILQKYEEWKWAEDFQAGLSRKGWELGRSLKLSPALSLILPSTEFSRKYSLLEVGYGGRMSLLWNLERTIRGLSLTSSLRGTHYEYAVPVAYSGKSNESWRLNSRIVIGWEFVKNLQLDLLFGRTWAWSVAGNSFDRFEMDQSLSWSPFSVASFSIGHSRGGNVLRSDGNSNLALYDNRDSSFYLDLAMSY